MNGHEISTTIFIYNSILSMYLIAVCVKVVIEMYFKYIEKNNNLMKSNYNENYSFKLINSYHYPFKRYRLPISNAIR